MLSSAWDCQSLTSRRSSTYSYTLRNLPMATIPHTGVREPCGRVLCVAARYLFSWATPSFHTPGRDSSPALLHWTMRNLEARLFPSRYWYVCKSENPFSPDWLLWRSWGLVIYPSTMGNCQVKIAFQTPYRTLSGPALVTRWSSSRIAWKPRY